MDPKKLKVAGQQLLDVIERLDGWIALRWSSGLNQLERTVVDNFKEELSKLDDRAILPDPNLSYNQGFSDPNLSYNQGFSDGQKEFAELPSAWESAVIDELVTAHIYTKGHDSDPKKALNDLICYHVQVALDPAVSKSAQALIDQGAAAMQSRYKPELYQIKNRNEVWGNVRVHMGYVYPGPHEVTRVLYAYTGEAETKPGVNSIDGKEAKD